MRPILQTLIELKNVDSELMQLQKIRGNLPQQVEALKKKLDLVKSEFSTTKNEFDGALKERLACETDIKTLNEKLKKYNEQIYTVKNNKEYDAITVEIETKESEINKTETRILELFEQEEKLSEKVKTIEAQVEAITNELQQKGEELKRRLEQTEAKEKLLVSSRKGLVPELSKPIYSKYERIRKGKGGIAVAAIENGLCTGCLSNLPPQTGLEIRQMDQLIYCQTCGRLLVWNGNNETDKNVDLKASEASPQIDK